MTWPSSTDTIVVRACIPHFFRDDEGGSGYGSRRPGSKLARSIALARCIHGLLNLQRWAEDAVLHIGDRAIDRLAASQDDPPPPRPICVEIVICTDGQHQLSEVFQHFGSRIKILTLDLDDPKLLPIAARDELIRAGSTPDLALYLEDDIVIHDKSYIDKQLWFLRQTKHRLSLMPHRYERVDRSGLGVLLVDGPLDPQFIRQFTKPQANAASGLYQGQEPVSFDITANPHSGTFALSKEQVEHLRAQDLPTTGFVSPLETAATLTVLKFFPVLKPSPRNRAFLMVEHGHPSFRHYVDEFPNRMMEN